MYDEIRSDVRQHDKTIWYLILICYQKHGEIWIPRKELYIIAFIVLNSSTIEYLKCPHFIWINWNKSDRLQFQYYKSVISFYSLVYFAELFRNKILIQNKTVLIYSLQRIFQASVTWVLYAYLKVFASTSKNHFLWQCRLWKDCHKFKTTPTYNRNKELYLLHFDF